MLKLLSIRIGLRHQFVIDIKLQMIAIGADHCLRETDRFVPASPMECWLQDKFFGGIALRLVETCRRLWFTENVGHAVIADPVSGSEVPMRVVVKRAPPDATSILRIRS